MRQWVRRAAPPEEQGGAGDGPAGVDPRDRELARLRRENAQVKLERDILAKAAAWFAKETPHGSARSSGS